MGKLNPVQQFKDSLDFAKESIGDTTKALGQTYQSMLDGSRRIGEVLTGGRASKWTGASTHTEKQIARSRPLIVPMPDEQALRDAQRRRFAGQVTSGRASTVLTQQQDDSLG